MSSCYRTADAEWRFTLEHGEQLTVKTDGVVEPSRRIGSYSVMNQRRKSLGNAERIGSVCQQDIVTVGRGVNTIVEATSVARLAHLEACLFEYFRREVAENLNDRYENSPLATRPESQGLFT